MPLHFSDQHRSYRHCLPRLSLLFHPWLLRGRRPWRIRVVSCWISNVMVIQNRQSLDCQCVPVPLDVHSELCSVFSLQSRCHSLRYVESRGTVWHRSSLVANACGKRKEKILDEYIDRLKRYESAGVEGVQLVSRPTPKVSSAVVSWLRWKCPIQCSLASKFTTVSVDLQFVRHRLSKNPDPKDYQ